MSLKGRDVLQPHRRWLAPLSLASRVERIAFSCCCCCCFPLVPLLQGREGKVTQVYRKKWVIHIERITREKVNGACGLVFWGPHLPVQGVGPGLSAAVGRARARLGPVVCKAMQLWQCREGVRGA